MADNSDNKPRHPFGKLNPVEKKQFKQGIAQDEVDSFSDIRSAVRKVLYNSNNSLEGEFVGVVLKRLLSPEKDRLSQLKSIFGGGKSNVEVVHYKVRVPEVHSMLPEPTSATDHVIIDLHHTFEYAGEELFSDGDYVNVSFKDSNGVFNPKILAPVIGRGNRSPFTYRGGLIDKFVGGGRQLLGSIAAGIADPLNVQNIDTTDKVMRWLPHVRKIRKKLNDDTDANVPASVYSDELLLAIIDKESSGNPRADKGPRPPMDQGWANKSEIISPLLGLLQMGDPFIEDAYTVLGNSVVTGKPLQPFDNSKLVLEPSAGGFERVLSGQLSIEASLRVWWRYRNSHKNDWRLIAYLHHDGIGNLSKVRKFINSGMSVRDAIVKGEPLASGNIIQDKSNDKDVPGYIDNVGKKMKKWRKKIEEVGATNQTIGPDHEGVEADFN